MDQTTQRKPTNQTRSRHWIAIGDETGTWDIKNGVFTNNSSPTNYNGISLVIGSLDDWQQALTQTIEGKPAWQHFSTPLATHLEGVANIQTSDYYHARDVLQSRIKTTTEVPLERPHDDPALERLRRDLSWLVTKSGLIVTTVSGNPNLPELKASGFGLSGDGLTERARAYMALLTPLLPFLPPDVTCYLLLSPRSEASDASARSAHQGPDTRTKTGRDKEPFRNFIAHCMEFRSKIRHNLKQAGWTGNLCAAYIAKPSSLKDPRQLKEKPLANLLTDPSFSLFRNHPNEMVKAIQSLADLAALLGYREDGVRFTASDDTPNLRRWHYKDLIDVFAAL